MESKEQTTSIMERLDAMFTYQIDLEKAAIYVAGEIDMGFTINLRMRISMLKQYWELEKQEPLKAITLVGNSLGGDATIILSMIDLYEELKAEGILVNVHFEGNCMSAATFICAGATGVRSAGKRCRFMIHEIQVMPPGGTYTQAKSFSQETAFLQNEMYKLYAQLTQYRDTSKTPTPKEIKAWKDLSAKESYLSSKQAKELGLIDEIS